MKSVSEMMQSFEQDNDPNAILVQFKGKKIEVYPWLKPMIYSAIQQGNKVSTNEKSISFQLKHLFSGFRFFFKSAQTIFFTNSLEKRNLNGVVYDKMFNELSQRKEIQPGVSIEIKLPSSTSKRSKYKDKIVASKSLFFILEFIYQKFFLRKIIIENVSSLDSLLKENSLKLDLLYAVKKNLAQYVVMKHFLAIKKSIKNVFLTVSYTNFGMILACKEKDISVIELQHGIINKEHFGYSYFYEPNLDQFPDYILTFGEGDVQFFFKSPLSKFLSTFAVGSFMIDYYLSKNEKVINEKVMKVAVSLQDCETGIEAVESFVELAQLNPTVLFVFKPRRLDVSFYLQKFTFPENIIFEEINDVYELILNADLHLTAYSSCAIEAPSLGTANLLFNLNNKARAYCNDKLLEDQGSFYCNSITEMDNIIKSYTPINCQELKKNNKMNIKDGYKNNIDSFLNLLSKK